MFRVTFFAVFIARVTTGSTLDVHVYNRAGTPPSVLAHAERVLVSLFRESGIELNWQVGPPDAPESNRVMFPEPVPAARERALACAARTDIALLIVGDGAVGPTRTALGYANPFAPDGINATVLYPRVTEAANKHGIAPAILLAHAIAHEIGHVLLRSSKHREHGLMAGGWDAAQFRWIARTGIFFERADARQMKATILREGCQSAALIPAP